MKRERIGMWRGNFHVARRSEVAETTPRVYAGKAEFAPAYATHSTGLCRWAKPIRYSV